MLTCNVNVIVTSSANHCKSYIINDDDDGASLLEKISWITIIDINYVLERKPRNQNLLILMSFNLHQILKGMV